MFRGKFGGKLGVSCHVIREIEYNCVKPKRLFCVSANAIGQCVLARLIGRGDMVDSIPEELVMDKKVLHIFGALRPEA